MGDVRLLRPRPFAVLVGLLFLTVLVPTVHSEEPRLSISGYDPVAYFTDSKAVPGNAEFEYVWHDARWRFASAAHRDLFIPNPGHYAPQFDGYCARGVGSDEPHKDTVDPRAWAIVDGKLYLTHTVRALETWRQNAAQNIKQADQNWSTVKNQPEPAIVGPPCRDHPPSVVISLRGGGRRLLVGGQVSVDKDGNLVGKGDMRAQIEQVGKNIQACLKAAGVTASDIILTRAYVTNADAFSKNADILTRYLGPSSQKSSTVQVSLSAGPDFLVEIGAIANLGPATAANADQKP
jgi:enamine deaminase RidA (YjgF/YER057c/UK114 family)